MGLAIFLLVGCAETSGDGASSSAVRDARDSYEGIPIRRTGNYRPRDREFQNRAIFRALAYLKTNDIPADRVTGINIGTMAADRSSFGNLRIGASSGLAVPVQPRYDLWVSIEGCKSPVHFISTYSGRPSRPYDKSGCLAAVSGTQ